MPPTSKSRRRNTKSSTSSRGLVRIIAGTHRGRRLPVLLKEGLRPTADRVKETLFNWLMHRVATANCLDMYAGSGALGIEALSRGAKLAVFIEQEKAAANQIQQNVDTLREQNSAKILQQDALSVNYNQFDKFDIVFMDPPFSQDLVTRSIAKLEHDGALANDAYVYIEVGHNDSFELSDAFVLCKQVKTSQALASLYQYSNSTA